MIALDANGIIKFLKDDFKNNGEFRELVLNG